MLTCSKCRIDKEPECFYPNRTLSRGRTYWCRDCLAAHREQNKNKLCLRVRAWREANPDKTKSAKLKSLYGISLETYRKMLADQGGRCAMCNTDQPGNSSFSVDHDHFTEEVRGLLCNACNVGLGLLGDDPGLAISKLRRYATRLEAVDAEYY